MPVAEARVQTADPDKYLSRLCRHASKMGGFRHHRPRAHGGGDAPPDIEQVEWSGPHGRLRLSGGQCTLRSSPGTLTLRAEAAQAVDLARITALVTARLERFGRRERLEVNWHPVVPGPLDQDDA